jgi:flavodoxin
MKSLVVYYSYEGHSADVASELARLLDADTLRIETEDDKIRHGLMKFVWGGKMAFSKQLPPLKPFNIDINRYDLIVAGGPVWAGSPAPAIMSFLDKVKISDKKTAFFLCHLGGPGKAKAKLEAALAGNTIVGEIDFRQQGDSFPELDEKLAAWVETLKLKARVKGACGA